MIIEIDDNMNGWERRKQIEIQQVIYASDKFKNNKNLMANFLGINRRTLTDWINRNEELEYLKVPAYEPKKPVIKDDIYDSWGDPIRL